MVPRLAENSWHSSDTLTSGRSLGSTKKELVKKLESAGGHCPSKPSTVDLSDYEDLAWHFVAEHGFRMPKDDWLVPNTWFWKQKHGWRVWDADGDEFWLCKMCHGHRSSKQHWFKSAKSTMRAKEHLKAIHRIGTGGTRFQSTELKKKRKLDGYMCNYDAITASKTLCSVQSNPLGVWVSLLQGIIAGHIALQDMDSPYLQQLVKCAGPQTRPLSPVTMSECITNAYDRQLRVAANMVASSSTKVSLSFQKYASNTGVKLLGVSTYFIDSSGRQANTLVSLPREQTRHRACNIAGMVSAIVAKYDLGNSLGYIITDDTGSMSALAYKHPLVANDRWIHCSSHILNLVAQLVLFGGAVNALEGELVTAGNDEAQQKEVWRRRGPCGRLRNIVNYIKGCSQLETKFEDVQRRSDASATLVAEADASKLVRVEDTRWESMHDSLERALHLRLALDEFIAMEISDQRASCRCKRDGSESSIAHDYLASHDWEVLKGYHEVTQRIMETMETLRGEVVNRLGAIWQVLPQFEALLACLDKSRQRRFRQDEEQTTSARLQDVQHDDSARGLVAGQKCVEEVRIDTDRHSKDAITQEEDRTAVQDRFNANIDRVFAQHEFHSNINAAWQRIHDHCETLQSNPLYVAAVVLHPRIKWRYLETKWKDRKDRLSTVKAALGEYWRSNYRDTVAHSHSVPSDASCDNTRAPDEWSDGEACDVDQFEQYQSERPDKSYESKESPVEYWVRRRRRWPQLATMALDIYSVPAMAGGSEVNFGQITKACSSGEQQLDDNTQACLMCLKIWQSAGIVNIDESFFE
jgi:hypothetical protein